MDLKVLGKEVLDAAMPGLKTAGKSIVASVVIPKLYDPVLDWVKVKIPGVWDDMIIESFRPKGKQALQKFIDNI